MQEYKQSFTFCEWRLIDLRSSDARNRLRLCFFAGGGIHTRRWIEDFVQKDCEIHWLTFDKATSIEGARTRRLRYRSKPAYLLRMIDVGRAINETNPDVVHAFYASHYGVYAALSGFHPLIISALGSDILISPERSKMFRFSLQFALGKADLVHAGDEGGRRTLIKLGCDPSKILTQEWGVDIARFSPNARSESLRKRLEIQDCYSVLSASSWQIDYSVDVLIRAMSLVLKQLPNVKIILLGGGVLEEELKALAKKLEVYENIVFVGRIPYEEMPMYLASVDVFVDTISDYAHVQGRTIKRRSGMGIGQTTKEAMACGIPQILPDHSSINYRLFKGLTYRQLDHVDLAEKLVHLLQNEGVRNRIGQESIRAVKELCDQASIAEKWYSIYHKLSRK